MTYIKLDDAIAAVEGIEVLSAADEVRGGFEICKTQIAQNLRALPTVSVTDDDIERIALQNAKEYLQGAGPWELDEIGITADDYLVRCFAKAIRESPLGATVSDGEVLADYARGWNDAFQAKMDHYCRRGKGRPVV